MDNRSCTLKVALDQTAPPQSISNSALGSATASVDALNSTVQRNDNDSIRHARADGRGERQGKTTMNIDIGGNRRQMNTVMSMKFRVTRPKSPFAANFERSRPSVHCGPIRCSTSLPRAASSTKSAN